MVDVDHPHMNKLTSTLVLAAVIAALTAASASASPPSHQILISHEVKGCHAWSLDGDAFAAKQTLTATPGTRLSFVDNDVMPHRLFQVSGPKVTLSSPNMHMMHAAASTELLKKGRYVFGTKAGEDYMSGVKTIGEDNVLRLVVVVK